MLASASRILEKRGTPNTSEWSAQGGDGGVWLADVKNGEERAAVIMFAANAIPDFNNMCMGVSEKHPPDHENASN